MWRETGEGCVSKRERVRREGDSGEPEESCGRAKRETERINCKQEINIIHRIFF